MSVNLDKIPAEESSEVEFKAFSGGLSTKELATTLCAFANSDGGSVYIRVTDSRQIAGVSVTASFLDQVLNAAQEYCSPSIPIAISRIVVGNGNKEVLVVTTERSPRLHSLISGDTLIRIGTQDKRVIGDELLRLAETKSQVSYEEVELTAGLEALDAASVEEYYRARRRVSSFSSALSVGELLEKIGLATVKNERFQVKAGAFILFGKPNSDLLLQREFTFLRYDGSGTIFQFREDIRLPMPAQVERLPNHHVPLITTSQRHSGGGVVAGDVVIR
jgi:predicted HTH transcriptional regulator